MDNHSEDKDHQECQDCESLVCDERETADRYRRNLIRAVAGGATISLAGCTTLFTLGDEPTRRERPGIEDDEDEDDTEDAPDPNGENDADQPTDEEPEETYEVYFAKQDVMIEVPADQSLLEAGEAHGLDLPYDCRQGFCGVCTSRLWGDATERVDMEGNQFLAEEEIQDGFTLTCVGFPRSDFTLESGERDALDR